MIDEIDKLCERLATAEAKVERLRVWLENDRTATLLFAGWMVKHPDVVNGPKSGVEMEEKPNEPEILDVHPNDWEWTAAESHCAKCARCQAYKKMADDEAKRHGLRATSYREELLQIVSYLGHYDQDANHAWMVRRIRAVLAGKNPNTVEGWTMQDGVPAPTDAPAKVVGTGYSPPKELWFHFHPAPHMVTPDGEERLAAGGDLWHDPFETKEEADAVLGESAVEGWVTVGPYTYEESALNFRAQQMIDLQAQVVTMRAETDDLVAQTLAMREEFDRDREKFDRKRAEFDRVMSFASAAKKENPS